MIKVHREATQMLASANISDIFVRANKDYDSITEAESVQLMVLITNFFRAWETEFLENRDGNLDEKVWEVLAKDYTEPMGAASLLHVWNLRKQNYDADFQKFIDELEIHEYVSR